MFRYAVGSLKIRDGRERGHPCVMGLPVEGHAVVDQLFRQHNAQFGQQDLDIGVVRVEEDASDVEHGGLHQVGGEEGFVATGGGSFGLAHAHNVTVELGKVRGGGSDLAVRFATMTW